MLDAHGTFLFQLMRSDVIRIQALMCPQDDRPSASCPLTQRWRLGTGNTGREFPGMVLPDRRRAAACRLTLLNTRSMCPTPTTPFPPDCTPCRTKIRRKPRL